MVLQCIAAGAGLFFLARDAGPSPPPDWLWWALVTSIWAALITTVYSGVIYVWVAMKVLKE